MSKTHHARWRTMLKYLGINNSHVANITGLAYRSVRNNTTQRSFSRWAKFTIWVFEFMLDKIDKEYRVYDFNAKDIYAGTAPPIKYNEEAVNKAIRNFKPEDNKYCKCESSTAYTASTDDMIIKCNNCKKPLEPFRVNRDEFSFTTIDLSKPRDVEPKEDAGEWVHQTTTRTDGVLRVYTKEKIQGKWFDVVKTENNYDPDESDSRVVVKWLDSINKK